MPTPPAFTLHTSFSPLISLYDTFLLDQFGVIHNGSQPLHGAAECIQSMLRQNKKMAILSNTSSPSHVAVKRLQKYGLSGDMFAGGLVSSGEECAKFVRRNYCSDGGDGDGGIIDKKANKKALWLTWKESESQNPLEFLSYCESGNGGNAADHHDSSVNDGRSGAKIDVAESVDEADFILLHGSEVWRKFKELPTRSDDDAVQDLNFLYNQDYDVIDEILERSLERKLPMVCANPDFIVGLPGGVVGNMPGKIAQRYEKEGGTVHHFGKPNPRHFHACLDNLNLSFDGNDATSISGVAHVGDSLEHDVAGANAAGIDSVFVLGGIHAEELGLIPTGSGGEGDGYVIVDDEHEDCGNGRKIMSGISKKELLVKLHSFFEEKGIWPSHVVPSLSLMGESRRDGNP